MWWLNFSLKDAIDITLLAICLFYTHKVMRSSGNRAIFSGIISFFFIWLLISQFFEMRIMGAILDKFMNLGLLVLVIIFQDDFKKILFAMGSAQRWKRFKRFFSDRNPSSEDSTHSFLAPIVLACMNMAKKKTGALIAIQGSYDLSNYEHSGERFVADINARLIENIFFKNSPMHDGAMIISGNKIRAAGCILPVANNTDLNKDLGLRHRSALGLSQKTDAKVIIISEERGSISVAYRGEIHQDISVDQLQDLLLQG